MSSVIKSEFGDFTISSGAGYVYSCTGPNGWSATIRWNPILLAPGSVGSGGTPEDPIEVTTGNLELQGALLQGAALQAAVAAVNSRIKELSDLKYYNKFTEYHNEFVYYHTTHRDIRDDIRELTIRGINEDLGIYTNHVCDTCEDDRALVMHALNEIKTTDAVLAERNNPTPPPDFLSRKRRG